MKIYTVTDIYGTFNGEKEVIGVFTSLADAEECVMVNSYYESIYEYNHYDCWGEDFFNDNNYLHTMLAYSHRYEIQEWEI